jgi:hypothetical protein
MSRAGGGEARLDEVARELVGLKQWSFGTLSGSATTNPANDGCTHTHDGQPRKPERKTELMGLWRIHTLGKRLTKGL